MNGKLLIKDPFIITSPFGPRKDPINYSDSFHRGTDYGTYGKKVPCYAPFDGEVLWVGVDSYGANFVYVLFSDLGKVGLYYHLDRVLVHKGQRLKANAKVGVIGSTGRSTGIHLHFGWMIYDDKWSKYYEASYLDFEKENFLMKVADDKHFRGAKSKGKHWGKKFLKELSRKGIVDTPEKHTDLDKSFTKAEVLALISKTIKYIKGK